MCIFFSFFLAKKRIGFSDWGFSFLLNESFEWEDEKHRVYNNLNLLSCFMKEKEYIDSEQRLIVNFSKRVEKFLSKSRNLNNLPATMFIHSWELTPEFMPKIDLPFTDKFITYYNLEKAFSKMEKLLKKFQFTSFERFSSKN